MKVLPKDVLDLNEKAKAMVSLLDDEELGELFILCPGCPFVSSCFNRAAQAYRVSKELLEKLHAAGFTAKDLLEADSPQS
jgi:hypothetical protein